jgi:hypothetical protein
MKRIPGLWEVSYDRGEERPTTTTVTSEKTSTTVTAPAFATGGEIELLPGGGVNRREGPAWKWEKDTYCSSLTPRIRIYYAHNDL